MSIGRSIDGVFDLEQNVQHHGILSIRSDLPSNKWQRRFGVVKDSFLFLFKEEDASRIRKSSYFNVKSQGIIPLGECQISPCSDQQMSQGIEISAFNNQLRIILGCDSRSQQLMWIRAFSAASRMTKTNFEICEQLIANLETQGLEKISMSEKYKKMFEDELMMRQTQEEEANRLLSDFEHLRQEKLSVESVLRDIESELAAVRNADAIEPQVTTPTSTDMENSRVQEERAALTSQLECERAAFARQATELAVLLATLAEEQRARRLAEERLAEAEASLARLAGCIVAEQTIYTEQQKQDMTSDVRHLKSYFESLASGANSAGSGVLQRPTTVRERARRLREQRRSRVDREAKTEQAGAN